MSRGLWYTPRVEPRVTERKRNRPTRLGDVLPAVLDQSGIAARLEQATVITEWASLVGEQIARVTHPLSITPQGVLFVAVKTNAWMTELSLLEPELLRTINQKTGRNKIAKIRWQSWR